MISLITNINKIQNDIADIIRLFYSFEKIVYEKTEGAKINFYHKHSEAEGIWKEEINYLEGTINKEFAFNYTPPLINGEIEYLRHLKRSAMLAFYNVLKHVLPKNLPWGALTGIRPTQFYRALDIEKTGKAHEILESKFDVKPNKIELLENIIEAQDAFYNKDIYNSVDLYIGIPFCPTRCEYCSFISFDMSRHEAPLEDYTTAIAKEIDWFNSWRKKNNQKIRSLYVGGGTPTAIGEHYLGRILEAIDYHKNIEITVEAGRPDTINYDILNMLNENGVTRISINPQSMNDATLSRMKRPHTSCDIIAAYELARKFGFIINMDVILGLAGETLDMVENTLDKVAKLAPDNLTVHTLAVKRASQLKEKMSSYDFTDIETINKMVDLAQEKAKKLGMHPYYLYRQKYMSGNLENVGYSMPGKECLYNVDVMEETHNLVALGAGAVSKRKFFEEKRHARFGNLKSVSHYIESIDDMLLKKDDFFAYN